MYSMGSPIMASTTTLKEISVSSQPVQKPHPQVWFFFFNDPATTEISTSLHTLSLHDALPILAWDEAARCFEAATHAATRQDAPPGERSEEHTSELQSRNDISYAVFCLKK